MHSLVMQLSIVNNTYKNDSSVMFNCRICCRILQHLVAAMSYSSVVAPLSVARRIGGKSNFELIVKSGFFTHFPDNFAHITLVFLSLNLLH